MPIPFDLVINLLISLVLIWLCLQGRRDARLPPGPSTWPVIGNLPTLITHLSPKGFSNLATQYGPILSLKVGNATMILIHDADICRKSLSQKTAIYSGRPFSPVFQAVSANHVLFQSGASKQLKAVRKTLAAFLSFDQIRNKHAKVVENEAAVLLHDLLTANSDDTRKWNALLLRFTCSTATVLAYGLHIPSFDNPLLQKCPCPHASLARRTNKSDRKMLSEWIAITTPGAAPPVDIWPWLTYLPKSIFNWQDLPIRIGKSMIEIYTHLFDFSKETDGNSFAARCALTQTRFDLTNDQVTMNSSVLLEAGGDIVANTLGAFLWIMINYPNIQRRARLEVELVCGTVRSPTYADAASMPYIECLIKEVLRFLPVVPLNIPHITTREDVINGYVIPEGSICIANIWHLHQDPTKYHQPEIFNPDRFREVHEPSVRLIHASTGARDVFNFGFGSRACPGASLAHLKLFVAIVRLLWAFDISGTSPPQPVSFAKDMTGGSVLHVKPFDVIFKPLSDAHVMIIQADYAEAQQALPR